MNSCLALALKWKRAAEVKIRAERGSGKLLINDPDFGRGNKKRMSYDFDLEDTESTRWSPDGVSRYHVARNGVATAPPLATIALRKSFEGLARDPGGTLR